MAEALPERFRSISIRTRNDKTLDVFAIIREHFPQITDLFRILDSSRLFQLRKYCVAGERLFIRVGESWEQHVIMERVSDSPTRNTYLTRNFRPKGNEVYMKVNLTGGRAWEVVPRVVELKKYYSYYDRNIPNNPFTDYSNCEMIIVKSTDKEVTDLEYPKVLGKTPITEETEILTKNLRQS